MEETAFDPVHFGCWLTYTLNQHVNQCEKDENAKSRVARQLTKIGNSSHEDKKSTIQKVQIRNTEPLLVSPQQRTIASV